MNVSVLQTRKLLIGVSGSIAAYKAATLVRLCKQAGADVQVLMTADATRFISPLTLGTLSGKEPLIDLFPAQGTTDWTKHVSLGTWADLFVIAPATAQTLARLAGGFCDSMLTATALSARCPLLICPAMDDEMYRHPAVRANIQRLSEFGATILPSEHGELASGLIGEGRLPEPRDIVARIIRMLAPRPLSSRHALVTAGPTREPLDPVRILTNPSTGTMGYALAAALHQRGADVTLISGPTMLDTPDGVTRIDVTTADEMYHAVQHHSSADIIFMVAAVADYTPVHVSSSKLRKDGSGTLLELRPTKDILKELGRKKRPEQLLVGFAMETEHGMNRARQKLKDKNLDFIVLNNVLMEGSGFGAGTNRVTLIPRQGEAIALPLQPKRAVADALLTHIFTHCG